MFGIGDMSAIDSLEPRRLLSAILSSAGQLHVGGTSGNDRIVISLVRSSPRLLQVAVNASIAKFPVASVNEIVVYGRRGNDRISIDGSNGVVPRQTRMFGGGGNDTVVGGPARDRLHGDEGNDVVLGSSNKDLLYGEIGEDYIEGGAGHDRMEGGAGNDTLTGLAGNDTAYGHEGEDNIIGGTGSDWINGGFGVDSLNGDDEQHEPGTLPGDDTLDYSDRQDNISIGVVDLDSAGNEQAADGIAPYSFTRLLLGSGNDFTAFIGTELSGDVYIDGGPGNDVIDVSSLGASVFPFSTRGTVQGGDGDDTIRSVPIDGELEISGGRGTDTKSFLVISRSGPNFGPGITVSLDDAPNDVDRLGRTYNVHSDIEILEGTEGDDTLIAAPGGTQLLGSGGADLLVGGAGNDRLDGGGGDDSITGNDGDDVLFGGGEDFEFHGNNDNLDGGNGNDVIDGGNFADVITGGIGNDRIDGGDGDDIVVNRTPPVTGTDSDTITGGDGLDAYQDDSADQLDLATLENNYDPDPGFLPSALPRSDPLMPAALTYPTDPTAVLSGGTLTITGTTGADNLLVTQSDFDLSIQSGGSVLPISSGGSTVDFVGLGAVRLVRVDAGPGNDSIRVVVLQLFNQPKTAILDGGSGRDTLVGGNENDYFMAGTGPEGADSFIGGGGLNFAYYANRTSPVSLTNDGVANDGAPGEGDSLSADINVLMAGSGSDTLSGGSGNDILSGGAGNDYILGNAGADYLIGSRGNDMVVGSAGSDFFVLIDGGTVDRYRRGPAGDIENVSRDPVDVLDPR